MFRIPSGVTNLATFRHWARSEEFPEKGRICFLNGEVWVDMSKEQLFTHNQVKGEFITTVGALVDDEDLGRFFSQGILLSNVTADLSCQPDGTFLSNRTLKTGAVRFVAGVEGEYAEIEGTPDMVLEIVSTNSVKIDSVILRNLYWEAGIPEYWLVDARGARPSFEILCHTSDGYTAARKQAGWVKSSVIGKSFKLTSQTDSMGYPRYKLAVR